MTELKIHHVFSTPVIQFKFDKHSKYNFPNIPKSTNKPNEWLIDLYTTFPNILDDDKYINAITRDDLKKDLQDCINKQFDELKIPHFSNFIEFWYNVYYENQGQELHSHFGSCGRNNPYWSGIYYYRTTSSTVFVRDSHLWRTQLFPNQQESNLKEFYYQEWYPFVDSGDIVLFPPHLMHYVPELDSTNEMRMTFSFNLDI